MPLKQRMQSSTIKVSGMHYALRGKSLSWLVTGIGYKTSEICCFDSSDRDGSPQHFLLINLRLRRIARQLFHTLVALSIRTNIGHSILRVGDAFLAAQQSLNSEKMPCRTFEKE